MSVQGRIGMFNERACRAAVRERDGVIHLFEVVDGKVEAAPSTRDNAYVRMWLQPADTITVDEPGEHPYDPLKYLMLKHYHQRTFLIFFVGAIDPDCPMELRARNARRLEEMFITLPREVTEQFEQRFLRARLPDNVSTRDAPMLEKGEAFLAKVVERWGHRSHTTGD